MHAALLPHKGSNRVAHLSVRKSSITRDTRSRRDTLNVNVSVYSGRNILDSTSTGSYTAAQCNSAVRFLTYSKNGTTDIPLFNAPHLFILPDRLPRWLFPLAVRASRCRRCYFACRSPWISNKRRAIRKVIRRNCMSYLSVKLVSIVGHGKAQSNIEYRRKSRARESSARLYKLCAQIALASFSTLDRGDRLCLHCRFSQQTSITVNRTCAFPAELFSGPYHCSGKRIITFSSYMTQIQLFKTSPNNVQQIKLLLFDEILF